MSALLFHFGGFKEQTFKVVVVVLLLLLLLPSGLLLVISVFVLVLVTDSAIR